MKKLISDSGGYKTFLEIKPISSPSHSGWVHLRISTVWEGARGKVEEYTKFEMSLDPEAKNNLKEILNEMQHL